MTRRMKFLRCLLPAALLAVSASMAVGGAAAVRFGVVMGEGETLDGVNLVPIASYLERVAGVPFEAVPFSGHQALMDALGRNDVQVALLLPAVYVKCAAMYPDAGVQPIVRVASDGDAVVIASVIVPIDSDIRVPAALTGTVFAAGGPYSLATHLIPFSLLRQAGVEPRGGLRDIRRFGSSSAMAEAILSGECAAGGLPRYAAETLIREERVRVVASDRSFASEPVCVNRFVDAALAAAIRNALLELGSDAAQERLLKAVNPRLTGFEPAAASDYDAVRRVISEIHGDRFYQREPPTDNP